MEKTVAVKLTARVSQYLAAMASASKATTGLATSASGLTKVGSSMQSVGANMTRYVSVPLVALGGAAVLMASKFETSFAQMVGLANVPASEVDNLRESVLSLAGDTARAPQELADALYLAASSGLDSAAAMEVVTLAAHGAAAGMGSTSDVVGLLTGAIGSYGAANLTAAEAADFLSATIREGRAAPEELATSMGRILPIAAAMNISMGEVGGALAFLTNTGLQTDEAVTSLRQVLVQLSAPGKAARDMLVEMGTSSGELQAAIADDGLTGALRLLREHGFDGNRAALDALMPDIRGLNGLTSLLADNTGNLDTIIGRVTDSTGSMGTAFGAVADTDAFKLKQAFTDIQVALIQVGAVLLPFAASAAKAISELVGWFVDLPGPVQSVAVAFAGVAAAAGPVLFLAGSLIRNWQTLSQTLGGSSVGIGSVAKSLGVLGLGIGAALYIFDAFGQSQRDADARTREVSSALGDATVDAWAYATAATGARDAVDPLTTAQLALSNALTGNTEEGEALTQALGALGLQTEDAWIVVSGLNKAMNEGTPQDYADFWTSLGVQMGLTGDQLELFAGVMGGTMPMTASQLAAAAEAAGFADGQFQRLQAGANGLTASVNLLGQGGVSSLADQFLNTAAAGSELGGNLVKLARAQAEAAGEGANSTVVYENFNALLPTLTDAQWDLVMGLGATTTALDETGAALEAVGPLWAALWKAAKQPSTAFGGDVKTSALDAVAALEAMATFSPDGETWVAYAESVTGALRTGADAGLVYENLMGQLAEMDPVLAQAIRTQLGLGKALMSVIPGTKGVAGAWGDAADAARGLTHATEGAGGDVGEFGDIMANTSGDVQSAADAMYAFTDAVAAAMGYLTGNPANLARAQLDVIEGFAGMEDAVNDNGITLDANTQGGRDNITMLYDQADAILHQSETFLENGYTVGQVSESYKSYRAQLIASAVALGLNQEQVDTLLTLYGLTPELVTTAFDTVGVDAAKTKTQELIAKYGGIPTSIYTEVSTAISQGDWQTAYNALSQLGTTIKVPVTPYLTNSILHIDVQASTYYTNAKASAVGRYVSRPMLSTLGETGPEVVLPLTNPARMSALLGMSEVGPKVAAAFGGMGGGSSGGVTAGATFNQYNTVNMPPGSDGDDVVRALRKWQRQRGPLPLEVR